MLAGSRLVGGITCCDNAVLGAVAPSKSIAETQVSGKVLIAGISIRASLGHLPARPS